MTVATKRRIKMAPVGNPTNEDAGTLMDALDNSSRGDGARVPVPTTITIDRELKARAQAAARARGCTLSYLVEQGLREVLGE